MDCASPLALFPWKSWCTPFVWVGANSITLYLVSGLGLFRTISERLVGHPGADWKWISAVATFAVMMIAARWLYRRGILLRV